MEGLGTLLLFALFFYFMMRFGCGAHMVHGHHHGGSSKQKHIDPVCGMQVDADKGYGQMYDGALYRFCSKDCLDKFDAEPNRYLGNDKDEGESV